MTADRAFDVKSLAEKWRCSPRTVYTLIEDGALRAFKIGKRGLRISAEEVERWQNENIDPRATNQATAPSDGADALQWPTSQIRALASVKG